MTSRPSSPSMAPFRFFLLTFCVGMLLVSIIEWFTNPFRDVLNADDPGRIIMQYVSDSRSFAEAWAAAPSDEPDQSSALTSAIQMLPVVDRQRLGWAWLLVASKGSATMGISAERTSTLWPYRHHLMPFQYIQTESSHLDEGLDNLLAYVAVAGSESIDARSLSIAQAILPRLEQQLKSVTDHPEIWDTVGCIYYRSGQWAKAQNAFANALNATKHIASGEWFNAPSRTQRAALESYRVLGQRRLDAAIRAATGEPEPLPLDDAPAKLEIQSATSAVSASRAASATSAMRATTASGALAK